MKILKTLALALAMLIPTTGIAAGPAAKNNEMKAIIIYFTHSGNTELAAKDLAKVTGAKAVRLYPEKAYTADDVNWTDESSRCTQEHLNQSLRPALKPLGIDLADYDTIFLGFPIWWHEEPAVIRTFLDTYDLKCKTIYPFCTSYESPMSEADATLRNGYPSLNWETGLRLPASPDKIRSWIAR